MRTPILCLIAILVLAPNSFANDSGDQFTEGMTNLLSFWQEVPDNIAKETHERSWAWGVSAGLIHGTTRSASKFLDGLTDVLTFPFPVRQKKEVHKRPTKPAQAEFTITEVERASSEDITREDMMEAELAVLGGM